MKAKKAKTAAIPKTITVPFIEVKQGGKKLLLTALPCWVLAKISYAAVRRQSDEKGAVQRPLNEKRISKIRDFALNGGDFPAGMILNWVKTRHLTISSNSIKIEIEEESAQLIDGQHRVAGLEEAIRNKTSLGAMSIPVAIYQNLTTQECADLFLAINSEQKPVPKSLAYDLFGVASSHVVDQAALRASDITNSLNDDEDSPYYRLVKYTGEPGGRYARLGIPLSTFVNAFKPFRHSSKCFSRGMATSGKAARMCSCTGPGFREG
jgi:DNA sulfur modification protein DndB